MSLGPTFGDLDLVFPTEVGTHIERQNLMRRSFWPILESADLPRIRFHDVAHSAAVLALSRRIHLYVVQERLGHSTIRVTLDVCLHTLLELRQEAAVKFDHLFPSV